MKSNHHPLPPWTPGHRLTTMIATRDSLMTYDEAIRCPSSWTPDHWMNAISQISGRTYDEPSDVQALPTAACARLVTFAASSPKLHNPPVEFPSGLSVVGTLVGSRHTTCGEVLVGLHFYQRKRGRPSEMRQLNPKSEEPNPKNSQGSYDFGFGISNLGFVIWFLEFGSWNFCFRF